MINTGIIGYGYWGPNLVRNFSNVKNCKVAMVADLDANRLSQLKNQLQLETPITTKQLAWVQARTFFFLLQISKSQLKNPFVLLSGYKYRLFIAFTM